MKKFFVLLTISLSVSGLYAQFNENWNARIQETFSSFYSNEGRKVVVDANSNVFVLGDYNSDLDSSGHPASGGVDYSVRIHKYDFNGVFLSWAFIPLNGLVNNGFSNKSAFGMELDAAGNLYIGYTALNAAGNFDVVIAKYTNNLTLVSALTYATNENDAGLEMKMSGNVAYAVVKSYTGANFTYRIVAAKPGATAVTAVYSFVPNVDVVNNLLPSGKTIYVTGYSIISGAKSAMTASVSSNGNLKWKQNFNHFTAAGDDYGTNLMIGTDGLIYVVGTTYTDAVNGADGMVMRYNTSGSNHWFILLNHATDDIGTSIAAGPSGFLFAGCSNSDGIVVYKIDMSPIAVANTSLYFPIPASPFTGIVSVTIADMEVSTNNNVYVCGTVIASSATGNFSASYLVKIGFVGFLFGIMNAQPVEGDNIDNYSSVEMVLDGLKTNILTLRNYWNDYSNHIEEKVYLNDLDGGVSLRLANNSTSVAGEGAIAVFPNPATDKISVRSNEPISTIEISDITGQVVKSIVVYTPADADINVADLRQGLYICRILTSGGVVSVKKLTIQ